MSNALRLVLVCLAIVGTADRAAAQEPRPGVEVSPYAGLLAFDQDFRVANVVGFQGLEDAFLFGGRVGYTFGRWFALEGAVGYSSQTIEPSDLPGSTELDVSFLTYGAEGLVSLAGGSVVPFLAAGLGGLNFEVDADPPAGESSNVLIGSFGGGLKLPVSPAVLIRADVRDVLVRQGDREVLSLFDGGGEVRHNVALTGGVSLRFGGPGDADHDGVLDDRDACPGTEPGLPVDKRGCVPEVPEGPPPIKTDSDGDGVSDGLDKCPGTPPGVVVDLDGCPVPAGTSGTTDR